MFLFMGKHQGHRNGLLKTLLVRPSTEIPTADLPELPAMLELSVTHY